MPPITTPMIAIRIGSKKRVNQLDPARDLIVVEHRDAVHHLGHVAAVLAHAEHARGDRRGESVRAHRLREAHPFADPRARGDQARLQRRVEEVGGHVERHDYGVPPRKSIESVR